jgi:hypothetical protein
MTSRRALRDTLGIASRTCETSYLSISHGRSSRVRTSKPHIRLSNMVLSSSMKATGVNA